MGGDLRLRERFQQLLSDFHCFDADRIRLVFEECMPDRQESGDDELGSVGFCDGRED